MLAMLYIVVRCMLPVPFYLLQVACRTSHVAHDARFTLRLRTARVVVVEVRLLEHCVCLRERVVHRRAGAHIRLPALALEDLQVPT